MVSTENNAKLMDMEFSVDTVANFLGVSIQTVYRRMDECDLSVLGRYSQVADDELDGLVSSEGTHASLGIQDGYNSVGIRGMSGAV